MSTLLSPIDETAIGKFFRLLQEKLLGIFRDIDMDYQKIPSNFIKNYFKNGQITTVIFSTFITILLIIYAIFYRIDKAKLTGVDLPYNIETISYQALDFTHPKYKGKYAYFPVMIFVFLVLFLVLSLWVLIIVQMSDYKVKGFYFIIMLLFLIPILVFIITYAQISKYLKPRNETKEQINTIFYKYMIDNLSARRQLSIVPEGGRYSVTPLLKALEILANETRDKSVDVQKKTLTKAIVTFTLYKYYLQKPMEDELLKQALNDVFYKYGIKGIDYCKYLPNNLRALTMVDISKLILYDRTISSVFTSSIVNGARKNASILLRQINGVLDKFNADENTIKKFMMTNTVLWIIFMMFIGIIFKAAMSYRSNTI